MLRDRINALQEYEDHENALLNFLNERALIFRISDDILESNISIFWTEVQDKHGFVWCNRQKDISEAFDLLLEFQDQLSLPIRSKEIGKLQFYESVCFWTGFAFKDESWKPDTFLAEEKSRAILIAKELSDFLNRSRSWPQKPRESDKLSSTLAQFASDLSVAPRDYSGPTAREKFILTKLAADLRPLGLKFDTQIGQLVELIARPMGFERSQRTILRHVKKSKS